jgi:hypothetical protein
MGNNRSAAVISDQIAIMMRAAIGSIVRQGREDVDERENDMSLGVHNRREQRQAQEGGLFSTLNTYAPERLGEHRPTYPKHLTGHPNDITGGLRPFPSSVDHSNLFTSQCFYLSENLFRGFPYFF